MGLSDQQEVGDMTRRALALLLAGLVVIPPYLVLYLFFSIANALFKGLK